MEKTNCIKKVIRCVALCAAALFVASCAEKPKSDNIIVHKRAKVQKKQTQAMSGYEDKRNVEWLGATYKVCVERKSDNTLPLTYDEQGNSYYDNRISVRVLRSDGSVFFERTFLKTDFTQYISDTYSKGALLGVVFDCVDGDALRFAASVGSPDKMSDEYEPLVVKVSRLGALSVAKDTKLDTASEDELEDEDDGV
uniref:DUF4738 domain-containing protein n=1 Tax=Prevotella sp. TaxID=59823 RepID=UPI004029961F